MLYVRTTVGYLSHKQLRYDFDIDPWGSCESLPPDATPIEARRTQYTWIISRNRVPQYLNGIPLAPTTVAHLVEMLPEWEKAILQEVHFIVPEEIVWTTLCSSKCHAASDGSAPKNRGSFGWILSDTKGERLVRCRGPVFGYAISSYRAEAFGMLSLLRFLMRMTEMHQTVAKRAKPPYLVCDNQSLVRSVTRMTEFPTIFPNTTMEAEWDCLAQIVQAVKSLGEVAPTIDHIAGHQDEETPYEQLSIPAQLNCDADQLANAYLQDNPVMEHTHSTIFPAGECVLQLNQGTITRDYKRVCAEAQTLPPLRSKIIQRSEWNPSVFDNVDWDAHGRALARHHKHRTTLIKYIHTILPLGDRVHKYDTRYPSTCPSCQAPTETLDHFWRCQAATRLSWRCQFLKDLNQKLIDLKTGPQVRTLLVAKLHAVLDGEPPEEVPVDPSLGELAQQQEQIGWEQLMRGRFGLAWNSHSRTQPATTGHKKGRWTTEVISFIFDQWWKLWEVRNQDRHGRNLATRQQARAVQVSHELTMFYDDYADKVPQSLRWIFDTTVETHRDRPTAATRQWLNTWRPIVEAAMTSGENPDGDPTNPENYPYTTALETG